jgi:hypothetical protein
MTSEYVVGMKYDFDIYFVHTIYNCISEKVARPPIALILLIRCSSHWLTQGHYPARVADDALTKTSCLMM